MPINRRNRGSRHYFITVHVNEIYPDIRSDFYEVLSFLNIITYCISVEKTVSTYNCFHIHSYFEFAEEISFDDLRLVIDSNFPENNFDLQVVKNKKNVLKYITKEDKNCYFNVKESLLNFYLRSVLWARRNFEFKYSDPFVVEHRNNYKFLLNLHKEIRQDEFLNNSPFTGFCQVLSVYNNWTRQCAEWWNDWVVNGFHLRKKQLFLYGPPGHGKTSFIETMINYVPESYIFRPCSGRFGMGGLDPEFHKLIIFEEFEENLFDKSYIKRILEGRPVTVDVKYESPRTVSFKGPVIIISNEVIKDMAILSRLLVVYSDVEYWESEPLDLEKLQKRVVEISSESE